MSLSLAVSPVRLDLSVWNFASLETSKQRDDIVRRALWRIFSWRDDMTGYNCIRESPITMFLPVLASLVSVMIIIVNNAC